MIDRYHGWNLSFKPLWIGFIISAILITSLYWIVAQRSLNKDCLAVCIILIGCMSALIQLIFFLHLGLEESPRWNLLMFIFGILLIAILIGGSIWIMRNLNYNVMPDM